MEDTVKIFGFMLVKNEADIIAQTLTSLRSLGGFSHIFIFDNGSTDDTLAIARSFVGPDLSVESLPTPFNDNLKYETVYRHRYLIEDGDWFAILDADEIFVEPLHAVVEEATRQGANAIEHATAQFYFSDAEDSYAFDPTRPVIEQRRHYLVNYGEPRIFRYATGVTLTADAVKQRTANLVISSRLLLVHHFQYRSAEQTQHRINIRTQNNTHSNNWGHVNSLHWQDYVVPHQHLHRFDGEIRYGLPEGANLYKIKDNAAYTMANLKWLQRHGHLTTSQEGFMSAGLLKRIVHKLW
jgi:glycosyltransferase involved in cell wall biosynthesis